MRIGIDARELSGRVTGVGRYLAGLLHEWSIDEHVRRHEFVLYTSGPLGVTLDARRFPTRSVAGGGGTWWEQVSLPRVAAKDHLDLLFAPAYSAPLLPSVPTVVAIHDLSFVAHPEWFTMREGMRRRWMTRQSAQRARDILTISDFSRQELDRAARRAGGTHSCRAARRRCVVEIVVDTAIANAVARSVINGGAGAISGGRRRSCSLCRIDFQPASSARSHPRLWTNCPRASSRLPRHRRRQSELSVRGPSGRDRRRCASRPGALAALCRRRRVERAVRIGARVCISVRYEGLGLTPLEALAAGVPPVLADTPVARESCGDAALYVKTGDIAGITRAIERLLFDGDTRQAILAAAPAVLARYSWPRAARETLAVLEGSA